MTELTLVLLLGIAIGIAVALFVEHRVRKPDEMRFVAPDAPLIPLPRDKHVNDYGFLFLTGGVGIIVFWGFRTLNVLDHREALGFLPALGVLPGGALIVVGWGIRHYRRWGWSVGLAVAGLLFLLPPIGTFFGIYGLWVLLRQPIRERFLRQEWEAWAKKAFRPRYLIPAIAAILLFAFWSTSVGIEIRHGLGLLKARTTFLGRASAPDVRWDRDLKQLTLPLDGRTLAIDYGKIKARGGGMPLMVEDGTGFGIVWSSCGGANGYQKFDRTGTLLYSVNGDDLGHAHSNALLAAKPGILCITSMENYDAGGPGVSSSTVTLYDWATGARLRTVRAGGSVMAISRDEETLYVAGWFGCSAIPLTRE